MPYFFKKAGLWNLTSTSNTRVPLVSPPLLQQPENYQQQKRGGHTHRNTQEPQDDTPRERARHGATPLCDVLEKGPLEWLPWGRSGGDWGDALDLTEVLTGTA